MRNYFFIFSIVFLQCTSSQKETENINYEDINHEHFEQGKLLFSNTCAPCHNVLNKEELFEEYSGKLLHLKEEEERIVLLEKTLNDKFHINKKIGQENFSQKDYEALIHFLLTPPRTVN